MADDIDRAQELEERHRAAAITAARTRKAYPPQDIECGKVFCLDCGEEIPPARLNVEPETPWCVECQGYRELKDRC